MVLHVPPKIIVSPLFAIKATEAKIIIKDPTWENVQVEILEIDNDN